MAGVGIKDHARVAVQCLSGAFPKRQVFTHLGWRKVGTEWVYLHAGGAIGRNGIAPDIEVRIASPLDVYCLPPPPHGQALVYAVQKSLRLLSLMPPRITYPSFSALWRAPLGAVDLSAFLAGKTGRGKTEYATLLQQHFGAAMDRLHLPANFSSTGNQLEHLAFLAKDALLIADDFCPAGSLIDVQRYHKEADRIFRAQGNHSGRGRLKSDGTPRPPGAPVP
jgi:hypothetical protein